MKTSEKLKNWYEGYINGALTTKQPKFWILFWGSVIACCIIYYVYTFWFIDHLDGPKPLYIRQIVPIVCCLLPFFILRRLHLILILFLIYYLWKWLL